MHLVLYAGALYVRLWCVSDLVGFELNQYKCNLSKMQHISNTYTGCFIKNGTRIKAEIFFICDI